ncbi:hypothetical protein F0562_005324 [Nyssa sinensis]|uniref:Uncharacterized protein n=1 Tax=Nyssa sinensis TaxID=561372 RepID=A0A5J5ALV7_9ASTE|nr:hypothetical protein F0562_005324 [Nyssa sinensis]
MIWATMSDLFIRDYYTPREVSKGLHFGLFSTNAVVRLGIKEIRRIKTLCRRMWCDWIESPNSINWKSEELKPCAEECGVTGLRVQTP